MEPKKSHIGIRFLEMLILQAAAGVLLLWLVFILPVSPMKSNLRYSLLAIQEKDGTSGELLFGDPSSFAGSFTDEIMIQNAVYQGKHGALKAAMGIYRQEPDEEFWRPARSLLAYLESDEAVEDDFLEVSYARYWHGYLVVLKPLLLLFSIEEIKLLNVFVFAGLFLFVILTMEKKGLGARIPGFAISCFFMMPLAMMLSLSLSVCGFLMLGACAWILRYDENTPEQKIFLFFAELGILTAYFDFLTYPVVTLGFPMVLLLCRRKEKAVRTVCLSAVWWAAGYGLFWGAKWLLGSVILRMNIFVDALNTVSRRTAAKEVLGRGKLFLFAVYKNLYSWKALPYLLILAAYLIVIIAKMIRRQREGSLCGIMGYVLAGLIPFGWMFAAVNHSYEHPAFTFRILAISLWAAWGGVTGMKKSE